MTNKTPEQQFADAVTLKSAAIKARVKGNNAMAEQLEIDAAEIIRDMGQHNAMPNGSEEYEFEVWQDDFIQAGGTCPTLESAQSEAAHFATCLLYTSDAADE